MCLYSGLSCKDNLLSYIKQNFKVLIFEETLEWVKVMQIFKDILEVLTCFDPETESFSVFCRTKSHVVDERTHAGMQLLIQHVCNGPT